MIMLIILEVIFYQIYFEKDKVAIFRYWNHGVEDSDRNISDKLH